MLQLPIEQTLEAGRECHRRRQLQQAETIYRQVLGQEPNHPTALQLLGIVLGQTGRLEAAVEQLRRSIAVCPTESSAHNNLGKFLGDLGLYDQAVASIREAIRLVPANSSAYYNLGTALQAQWKLDEAMIAYRNALRLNPGALDAANNLATTLAATGRLDESIAVQHEALAMNPNLPVLHSNMVYGMLFHPAYGTQDIKRELAEFNRIHAEPLAGYIRPHSNDRSTERRLRIGYVSPDFRDHVVGRNLIPLLAHHDPKQFEIHCFSNTPDPDALTQQFRQLSHHIHEIRHLADSAAADSIRNLSIDILVDLSLHLAGNRLGIFAHKPAPVQVTFAGYPGSTGLKAIDYRISDRHLDPPGNDEDYVERTVRLPDSFWCFDPLTPGPTVNDLPAQQRGHITFGSLNSFRKINEMTLELWSKVLSSVPGSRLIALAPEGEHRKRTADFLRQRGIASDRITFADLRPRPDYLKLYLDIDIGLDTLPYNGHSTSLDSFYMGVPVVTWVGKTVAGRAGLSQLMNLGMPELIAETDANFVRITVELARDLPRLAAMRKSLRGRLEASPLMDARQFAGNMEAAYRHMWRQWCAGIRPTPLTSMG